MWKTLPSTRRVIVAAALWSLMSFATPLARGQGDPAAQSPQLGAATQQADSETLEVIITGVDGIVQVRTADDQPWQPAVRGMKLNEGAEFRTGPRSAVRFMIPPDQIITLDRLGTVKVLQAIREKGRVKTDLGMKYGRTRYDIEAAGIDHSSTIRSPAATLSIRGTRVSLYDQAPFGPEVRSLTGRAVYTDRQRRKQVAFGKNKPTAVAARQGNAAATANSKTVSDPQSAFAARTPEEELLLLSLKAYGGNDFKDLGVLEFLDLARRGEFSGSVIGSLPIGEELAFRLSWTGSPFANVDLTVISPKGEVLSAANPEVASTGVHGGDNAAGSNGIGQEAATWVVSFPPGNYTVKADLKTGEMANIRLFTVQDQLGRGDLISDLSGSLTSSSPNFTTQIRAPKP